MFEQLSVRYCVSQIVFHCVCDPCVAVPVCRIHVLHSKHAVFYDGWCQWWGKAKIQALSAEVIKLLTDSL